MNEQEIFQELVNILRAYTKDVSLLDKVTKETHILNDLKIDSARLVDFVVKCEDVFSITIEDDEADKIETIGDALSLIKKKLS